MNKTMIALAVSAAALATNAVAADGKQAGGIDGTSVYSSNGTSLEIGGRAEARLSLKDGKAEDKTRVRLNFLGKVEIQDGLYGVGFYEGEFTTACAKCVRMVCRGDSSAAVARASSRVMCVG